MKIYKSFLPLHLQLFADNPPNEPSGEPPIDPPSNEPPAEPKTYTQEQLEEIVKQRVTREKKAAEKAVKEAEKLAKMNEEQKKQYEFEQLQKELEEYKRKDTFYSLSREASKMLSDNGITADDELLAFIVKDTAEDTQTAVNSFVTLLNTKVEEGVKKALAGNAPKVNHGGNKIITKEQIMAEKDTVKRQNLIKENIHLFKK